MRHYVGSILKQEYQILEAANGQQGLQLAHQNIPDLIISDIMMPEMDGIELCRLLKNDEDTSHIPIILLTAKGSEVAQVEGLKTGADDYIVKPFSQAVLLARLIVRGEGFLNLLAFDIITDPKLPAAPVKMGHDNLPFFSPNLSPVCRKSESWCWASDLQALAIGMVQLRAPVAEGATEI
jgi:CheY-like chemotaxis protein